LVIAVAAKAAAFLVLAKHGSHASIAGTTAPLRNSRGVDSATTQRTRSHPATSGSNPLTTSAQGPQADKIVAAGAATSDSWPRGTAAWTVQVGSFHYLAHAQQALNSIEARGASTADSGILRSDQHPGMHPGYWVVYSGLFATRDAATTSSTRREAIAAGFNDAFPRYVFS
jgi:hypothetical protein